MSLSNFKMKSEITKSTIDRYFCHIMVGTLWLKIVIVNRLTEVCVCAHD